MKEGMNINFNAPIINNGGTINGDIVNPTFNFGSDMKPKADSMVMVSDEQMVEVVETTMHEGLWWASTAWAVVYVVYLRKGYLGNMSDFERAVPEWPFNDRPDIECKADSFGKLLRRDPLNGTPDDWEKRGIDHRAVRLGKRLFELLPDNAG